MNQPGKPPVTYEQFIEQYPKLALAWSQVREAEKDGPLDERTARLVKLGVAIGTMREGAVHSAVRKATAAGITRAEIAQVVALSASTLGFPATVAIFSWIRDVLRKQDDRNKAADT